MNNKKEASIEQAALRRALRAVLESGGEAGALGALKRTMKNMSEDALIGLTRGELKTILKAIPSNLSTLFSKSPHAKIVKFFTTSNEKNLVRLLGQNEFDQVNKIIERSIIRATPKESVEVVKGAIKEVGGGRNFIRKILYEGGTDTSFQAARDVFAKNKNNAKNLLNNVDNKLSAFFKKNTKVKERLLSQSLGEKAISSAKGWGVKAIVASNVYSLFISLWDHFAEKTTNVNKAIAIVISELKDTITEGATTKSQDSELVTNIRKLMKELMSLNKDLFQASISSKMKKATSKEQVPEIASYYKKQIDSKVPAVKETVAKIDFVFNNIIILMEQYDAHWAEYATSAGMFSSSNRAKQVLKAIEQAKPLLESFVVEFESLKNRSDKIIENSKENITSKSSNRLMLVAQEMEKKSPESDDLKKEKGSEIDSIDDLYKELATKKIKEKDPVIIEKAIAPLLKVIPKDVLLYMASNPTKVDAFFSSIDLVLLKAGTVITNKTIQFLATKGVPAAMSFVGSGAYAGAGKGVALAVGSAAGVLTSALTGLDIGHYLGKLFFGGDGTLIGETTDLLNYLELADGGAKGTDWTKLNKRLQTKLAGSAYIIEKGIKQLESNRINSTKLTADNIKNIHASNNAMIQIFQGIGNIKEVSNILKQSQTRDLYIKHGENVAGMIGRGGDAAINFVATFGGLFGDRDIGENPSGFLNIYNAMMDFVKEMDGMLLEITTQILPYLNNLKKIKKVVNDIRPLIAEYSEEIKEGKV